MSDSGGAPARALLVLEGIEKSFGPVQVLRGVDLEVRPSEVHAVLGENGAGKSTLMRILLGVERPDRGSMQIACVGYTPRAPDDARRAGIVMVPQERTLCPHLDVLQNIVLGIEPAYPLGWLRQGRARHVAARALALVAGVGRIDLGARAGSLGVADQQLVEIARALAQGGVGEDEAERGRDGARAMRARVLILDEPTASLGRADSERLFARIDALRSAGLGIVLVTHFLADVKAHADRYTVLRDGQVRGAGDPRSVSPKSIVHEMLGRELEELRSEPEGAGRSPDAEPPLLRVEALAGLEKPRSASFVLRRGEILGIAGLVGSGRTEILRMVLGLDRVKSGTVASAAPRGIGLLSEDRAGEGLMLDQSIAENIALSPRSPLFTAPSTTLAAAARWITTLKIKASGPDQRTGDLSGGNQQKVQIARLLREDFDVLLVDEPTRGIDVASKAQVLELLRQLARHGKGIVLVSSQLDELVSTCDRIAVLRDGELGPARPATEWDDQKLLLEAAS